MKYDVFISYSRVDTAFAVQIKKTLEEFKLVTWLDTSNLTVSNDIHEDIRSAILDSRLLVVILSPDAKS
ncbi:MAG: toll/interleukin-1 receptor domain-containing protein [Chloroflexota bacterium]